MPYEDPATLRRRLQRNLRALRTRLDLTQKAVADKMDWSPSKVIRIESGSVGISTNDLTQLLRLYQVEEADRAEYISLNKESRKQSWTDFRDVLSQSSITFFGYEASAGTLRQFEPLLLPGLLQTEEYTRALLKETGWPRRSDDVIEKLVESRKVRQQLFDRDPIPELFFIIGETALRQEVGGNAVMKHQLDHVAEVGQRDRISIQIIPFGVGSYPGLVGPFTLVEFNDEDTVLYLESRIEDVTREVPERIGQFLDLFQHLERELATSPDDIQREISRIKNEAGMG